MLPLHCLLLASSWPPPQSRYEVVILGTGLKESLLAGLLASHGKSVLQLAAEPKGDVPESLDLAQLVELGEGPGGKLPTEAKVGKHADYVVERAPKMLMASSDQLQLLANSSSVGVSARPNPERAWVIASIIKARP